MAKDPAFLFYPNDWIGGTMGMTFEEKGAYMELLMLQFNRGHMTKHMMGQTVGQVLDRIIEKFALDENGLYYNPRLEDEKNKRKSYVSSRYNNKTGGNQYSQKGGHMTNHMEDEDVIINNSTIIGEFEISFLKLSGWDDLEISIFNKCEVWQLKSLKDLVTKSNKNFESIAMNNSVMKVQYNFKLVLQEFVNMIQSTGEYQEVSQLRRHFGNWVAKKNGTLQSFVDDCKNKNILSSKNKNSFI